MRVLIGTAVFALSVLTCLAGPSSGSLKPELKTHVQSDARVLSPSFSLSAQTSASLEVIVRDPSGALINKAQVQLIRNGKPQSTAQTNQRGEARFNKLAAGSYQLLIEA